MSAIGLAMGMIGCAVALFVGIMIFSSISESIDCSDLTSNVTQAKCNEVKDISWTVIGLLPLVLFFVLFLLFGSLGEREETSYKEGIDLIIGDNELRDLNHFADNHKVNDEGYCDKCKTTFVVRGNIKDLKDGQPIEPIQQQRTKKDSLMQHLAKMKQEELELDLKLKIIKKQEEIARKQGKLDVVEQENAYLTELPDKEGYTQLREEKWFSPSSSSSSPHNSHFILFLAHVLNNSIRHILNVILLLDYMGFCYHIFYIIEFLVELVLLLILLVFVFVCLMFFPFQLALFVFLRIGVFAMLLV